MAIRAITFIQKHNAANNMSAKIKGITAVAVFDPNEGKDSKIKRITFIEMAKYKPAQYVKSITLLQHITKPFLIIK